MNYFVTVILVLQNLIVFSNSDRGSFVGCYRKNLYFRRLNIFSGQPATCISGCENIFFRYYKNYVIIMRIVNKNENILFISIQYLDTLYSTEMLAYARTLLMKPN